MSADEFTTQRWTFAGCRMGSDKKLSNAWIDHHGESHWFPKTGSPIVGGIYEVESTADGSRARLKGGLVFVGRASDYPSEWDLKHREATTLQEMYRAEAKAKADNPLGNMTLNEVRAMMAKRLPSQRAGMLAAVISYITGGVS